MAVMDLPVMPPAEPMLAKAVSWEQLDAVTDREHLLVFEPEWGVFRRC